MTKEGYKKHRKVIEAWASGAEVEVLNGDKWLGVTTCDNLDVSFSYYGQYRIKPKIVERWINVYASDKNTGVQIYTTRESAFLNSASGAQQVKIQYEEKQ